MKETKYFQFYHRIVLFGVMAKVSELYFMIYIVKYVSIKHFLYIYCYFKYNIKVLKYELLMLRTIMMLGIMIIKYNDNDAKHFKQK